MPDEITHVYVLTSRCDNLDVVDENLEIVEHSPRTIVGIYKDLETAEAYRSQYQISADCDVVTAQCDPVIFEITAYPLLTE